ncbi:MAG: cupin domain-containing protein, partial [Pseudomonadota bacterium]
MSDLASHRTVANIGALTWTRLVGKDHPDQNTWWHNISFDEATGQGSYFYKMDPGSRSEGHVHDGPEEFFVVEGSLTDNDGHTYTTGDFVSLAGGSKHYSTTETGCLLVVTHRGLIR